MLILVWFERYLLLLHELDDKVFLTLTVQPDGATSNTRNVDSHEQL